MLRDNLLVVHSDLHAEIGYLTLEGELLAESRYEPERILREWHENEIRNVIVICAGLTHIDSAGFSILLGALHRYRRDGGDLLLTQINPSLQSIFEGTSMQKYFNIFPGIEEAREHLVKSTTSSRSKRR